MTRKEAIKQLNTMVCSTHINGMPLGSMEEVRESLLMAIEALEQEPKIGRWIKSNIGGAKVCSACKAHMGLSSFKYCPNCGEKKVDRRVKGTRSFG